jgi:hypothetical protein
VNAREAPAEGSAVQGNEIIPVPQAINVGPSEVDRVDLEASAARLGEQLRRRN